LRSLCPRRRPRNERRSTCSSSIRTTSLRSFWIRRSSRRRSGTPI